MLISFEGIEAVGKTTQIDLLEKYLKEKNYSVLRLVEPGGTSLGEEIRRIIKTNSLCSKAELLLFSASRAQLVNDILEKQHNNYDYIILDRFYHSTFAYQGWGRQLDIDIIKTITNFIIRGIKPDMIIYLDLPVEESLKRIQQREKIDKIEAQKKQFHERVYQGFKEILQQDKAIFIDAQKTVEKIHQDIISHIK